MAKKEEVQQSSDETALAEIKKQELAMAAMYAADSGSGFEEADSSAFAIPFLRVLQSTSPQCKKSDGAYIKGAEEGMIYNTVTGEIYDGEKGVVVIPCHYNQRYIEWEPRDQGGGFVAEYLPNDEIVNTTTKNEKNQDVLPNGNSLVDTRNHFVLMLDDEDNLSPALIAMSSTMIKVSKNWMSKMQGIKVKTPEGQFKIAPMHSRKYRLTTVPKSNESGSWFVFNVELEGLVLDPAAYAAAGEFREAVRSGQAQAKHENESTGTAGEENVAF